jgi:hypothetical protein
VCLVPPVGPFNYSGHTWFFETTAAARASFGRKWEPATAAHGQFGDGGLQPVLYNLFLLPPGTFVQKKIPTNKDTTNKEVDKILKPPLPKTPQKRGILQ